MSEAFDNPITMEISMEIPESLYQLNDIILFGLLFKCNNNLIEDDNKYKIIISNNEKLYLIDKLFGETINNYNSFLTDDNNIEIKKNKIITNILKKYKNKDYLYINIKFINKYTNKPVIYII